MDIQQTLQARANRRTRTARPFSNFFEQAQQCTAAGQLILDGSVDPKLSILLERSTVITLVTAIEVYYRDILDFIFRYCSRTFFEPHLKTLFPEKFDISDLLDVYRHQVHPLELVSAAQSFQNAERIDKVFSKFLQRGSLWQQVLQLRVRIAGDEGEGSGFTEGDLSALRQTFALRHELVHDPARRSFFTEKTLSDLNGATTIVFGSDLILSQLISENRDPALIEGKDV